MGSWFGHRENEDQGQNLWTALTTRNHLNEVLERSESRPQVIFKHSTRCIISKMVLRNFEEESTPSDVMDYHLLDLIAHREVSNAIASDFGVHHQSPQLIIVYKKRAVYDRSHQAISSAEVESFIKNSLI
ncbi:MAG: bacillithiol system redox-active protein YtxJ [Bacteroidetes bacterium]|jgi:bacillithiol system protein YtxJ|nr:bacillithiol system redox-active protein YtxJ [Bacteroidota bacterium]MDA0973551.1 bacillithiol system redox-active protein YtxJ [Bacteroidota bacterium]